MSGDWLRVSREKPCPICGKPNWCIVARDGGAAICARTESSRRAGEAGYLHRLHGDGERRQYPRRVTLPAKREPSRDFAALAAQYRAAVTPAAVERLAVELGVNRSSLWNLGIGWDSEAWTFPMRDAAGTIIGIRRRFPDGRKLSVTGGREGLFIPDELSDGGPLLIAEGPTDTAAMLSLGFAAIGRPSCTGGVKYVCELARGREAVIVSDGDAPGRRGAESLARALALFSPSVRVIRPPDGIKDARAWLCAGATAADVRAAIEAADSLKLEITTRRAG